MTAPLASRLPALARALEEFARRVRERYGDEVVALRLFGSYARGDADEDSDVDVAVVLAHLDWGRRRDVIDLAADVGLEHDLWISPTLFDRSTYERWRRQERALVADIEREGTAL